MLHQQVVGLQVPVHHAVDVEEVQPAAYLAEVVPRELLAHALAAVPRRVVHRPARHVLERHEHVLPRGVVDDLVQANDVGMHQLLHDGDLTLQPRVGAGAPARQTQTELASQRPAVDALQRAQPVGVRVEAELHLAERALAQVLDDDVLVQVHVTARVRAEVERLSVPEVTDAEAPVAERIDGGHRARGLPQNPAPGAFSHPSASSGIITRPALIEQRCLGVSLWPMAIPRARMDGYSRDIIESRVSSDRPRGA